MIQAYGRVEKIDRCSVQAVFNDYPGIDVEIMLKQRLVGAAMIIALAVVLIPMILDGAGLHVIPDIPQTPRYVSKAVPKTIRVNHHQVPRPVSRRVVVSHKKPSTQTMPGAADTVTRDAGAGLRKHKQADKTAAARVSSRLPDDGKVQNKTRKWVVQVASFRQRENARILKHKLQKAGFAVFIQRTAGKSGSKPVYRVRIGPEQDQARLKQILERLKQQARLNGYVVVLQ